MPTDSKGFTLIELIVTVTIIAMISVVAILGFGQSQARARDARRIADVGSLGIAIESYRTATGSYIAAGSETPITATPSVLDPLVSQGLITNLPHEPKPISGSFAFCNSYTYTSPWSNRTWEITFRAELDPVNGHSPLDATIDSASNMRCANTSAGGFSVFTGAVH